MNIVQCLSGSCLILALAAVTFGQNETLNRNIVRRIEGPKKWALLIGVDDYIEINDLRYCGRDVEALHHRLSRLGFNDDQMFLLNDTAVERKDRPYLSNINKVTEFLLGKLSDDGETLEAKGLVAPGDLVVIAFSGHGVHIDGESYFCPIDADLDHPGSLLSLNKLYRLLDRSRADVKLMLVDACRDDPRLKSTKQVKQPHSNLGLAASLASPPEGIVVLSSCAPGQESVECHALGHGVFMNFVLQGLTGMADRAAGNGNQRVSFLELFQYASEKTTAYAAQKLRVKQTPELKGRIVGDFELGKLTAADAPRVLRAFLICDDADPAIGQACAADRRAMQRALGDNIETSRLKIYNMPYSALAVINEVFSRSQLSSNDALFVYVSGKGFAPKQGGLVLDIDGGETQVVRSRVMDAMIKQDLPLTILVTDVSAEFAHQPKRQANDTIPKQVAESILTRFAESPLGADVDATSLTSDRLFFQSDGVIDVNCCQRNQFSLKHASDGSLFTTHLAKALSAKEPARDDSQGWKTSLRSAAMQAGIGFAKQYPEGRRVARPDGGHEIQTTQALDRIRFDITATQLP